MLRTDWETDVSLGMWIGIQEEAPGEFCLWLGQEEAGVCVNDCDIDPRNPSEAAVASLVNEYLEQLKVKNGNGNF